MHEQIDRLLQSAELSIVEFDLHVRNEMNTFNRSLPCYVMSFQKTGEAKLRVGDELFAISPGTVVIIPPTIIHDHFKETNQETIFLWFHFTYQIGNVIDVLKLFNFPITFQLKDSEKFEKVFMEFMEINEKDDFLSKTILTKAKSYEMLYLLLESIMNSKNDLFEQSQSEGFLCMLTQIIKNPEKDFSLKELSAQFHLHPTYISNRFKEIFGKSPIQVQRELKIERAKKLLRSTQMSVTEIAYSLGFPGIPGFTRLFKSLVGLSPSQYRTLNKRWSEGS